MRPEVHDPTCPLPSCASECDHFEILKHTAKGIGRKFFRRGGNGQNKTKNSTIKPPPTLSAPCMKIQGGSPPPPAADAHAYYNECVLSVDCRLKSNF